MGEASVREYLSIYETDARSETMQGAKKPVSIVLDELSRLHSGLHTVLAALRKLKMVLGGAEPADVVCRLQNFKANQSACRNAGRIFG